MTNRTTNHWTSLAAAVVGLGGIIPTAEASLLGYEGFDYTAGQTLNALNGGTGFSSAWTATNNGGYSVPDGFGIVSGGTLWNGTLTSLPQTGNYAGSPVATVIGGSPNGNNPDQEWASRTLSSTVTGTFTNGNTTWMSYVVASNFANNSNFTGGMLALGSGTVTNRGNVISSGSAVGIGIFTSGGVFRSGSTTPPSGPVFFGATVWDPALYTTPGIPLNQVVSAQGFAPSTVGLQNQAYIGIAKIVWSSTGGTIYATAFPDGTTLTEAAFDAAAVSQSFTANPADFNTISLAGARYDVDELRLATSFTEVIGGTLTAVPEPAQSLGLMSLLGLGLFVRNRRK